MERLQRLFRSYIKGAGAIGVHFPAAPLDLQQQGHAGHSVGVPVLVQRELREAAFGTPDLFLQPLAEMA